MGNPAKPAALRNLEGDRNKAGKRAAAVANPEPRRGAPRPPDWLKGEALAEWGRVVPELVAIGLLSVVDRAALTAYVNAWATFVSASADIEDRGTIVRGRDGNSVKNPSVGMQRDALQQIKVWCGEFGLTPSARARMALPGEAPAGEDADIARLFAG